MLDVALAQPLQDRFLRALGLVQQGLINETTLFGLGWQIGRRTEVGLICEQDKKFSLLAVSRVFHHPGRDLFRRRHPGRWTTLTNSPRGGDRAQRCDGSCEKE
jgi:hypothetical protein